MYKIRGANFTSTHAILTPAISNENPGIQPSHEWTVDDG